MRRTIGHTGLTVNAIGLGAMPLSLQGRPDEKAALAVIAAFLDNGGDFIDTASSYCLDDSELGHNERLIAKALRGAKRSDAVVATKGGLRRPAGRWETDCSPQWLRECCEASARDLGAPIALYYLHAVDSRVPLADSLGELVRLREAGTIGAIGLSNVTMAELEAALRITPIAAVQNRCNLYDRRDFQSGLVERCRQLGIAYVPYSPVGGHHGHRRLLQDAALGRIAAKHGVSSHAIAIAWLLTTGAHVLPIPGASKTTSVESSVGAARVRLDALDLEALTVIGTPAAR
jgi:aryl-alcohol dehydrogenase-like predicted oxidoreductase